MLFPWSLLHIRTDLTTTVAKTRFSLSAWRRTIALLISLRSYFD